MRPLKRSVNPAEPKRIARTRLPAYALAAFLFFAFCALGTWQVQRLEWKLNLIERVEARAFGVPQVLPAQSEWPAVQRDTHEYLKVRLQGVYLPQYTSRVQASTVLGPGHWWLTPLQTSAGLVWVNRGYAPSGEADPLGNQPTGKPVEVVGLLRITEPGGGFLRSNQPEQGRWFSRDVQAMSARHGLAHAAPFFVDAGEPRNLNPEMVTFKPQIYPVDGLTIVRFTNNHLMYAITWYALALLVAIATVLLRRHLAPR
ncbi:MAG TPA: SURF1 family cytochrome oxidase biogenesis protein [Limnobacter sp.]|nr:SURF1 family cytochrome oxidase biogenesis protein [Limnobacter sp.]